MYRNAKKVNKYPPLIFGSCFKKYLWKKKYPNISIIVPVPLNDAIYRMEGIHKMPKFGKKVCGRTSDIKSKKMLMGIF